MRKLLFIIILLSVSALVFSQRENTLPLKALSSATDSIRVVIDNQSSIMLRSVLQGAIYDSLATHTDTLQALRADIDAGGSSLLLDSIAVHRTELNDLHDSIADHRIDIDANLDSIGVHRTELNNAVDSLAAHRTEINANTSTGSTNATNISSNSVFIGVNTSDISDLQDSITKHTDTLQVHQDQIAALDIAYGSEDQIPATNSAGDDFDYSSDFTFDGDTLNISGEILLDRSGAPVLGLSHNADNAIIESQSGYGLWIPIPSGEIVAIGPNVIASTFVTIDDNNTSGLTNTLVVSNSSGSMFTVETSGAIYIPQLGDDDTEDHLVAIDDGTGLLTKRSVASLPGGGGVWTKTSTNLSPTTAGDDILLPDASEIHFGSSDNRIVQSSDEINIYAGGDQILALESGTIIVYDDIIPNTDNFSGVGISTFALDEVWSYEYDFKERAAPTTPAANTGTLYMDSSDEKPYFANSTTTYDLTSTQQFTGALTDGIPTDAQIDSATGTTPAAVGAGWRTSVLDTDGSALVYLIVSDGSNWQYTALTIAL